jgi:hypothetical protein
MRLHEQIKYGDEKVRETYQLIVRLAICPYYDTNEMSDIIFIRHYVMIFSHLFFTCLETILRYCFIID